MAQLPGLVQTGYRQIIGPQLLQPLRHLDGAVAVGDEMDYFDRGKVLVAAANPDLMESYIEEHDLVILGNRYESQLCAIEMNAGCLVVCLGAPSPGPFSIWPGTGGAR